VVGTQQRTTDPNAFDHRQPHPAHGPAAPVNSHPETPRQPGSAPDRGSLLIAQPSF
jgi:hypothetical protein